MSRKSVLLLLTTLIILVLCWYFFIKDYNYKITFQTPHAPGTVYSAIHEVSQWKEEGLDSIYIRSKTPFKSITHRLHYGDSLFQVEWQIDRIDDSLTRVTALAKDLKNSFKQNLFVPFKKNAFVTRNIRNAESLMNGLYVHAGKYKVRIESTELVDVPSQFCAYITIESDIFEKGKSMISNVGLIMNYLKGNEIEITGDPFLIVQDWDQASTRIKYDFCFPIKKLNNFPETEVIKFKNTDGFKALKAIFNGNYRLSDRAWYELIDFAESRGMRVRQRPFEIYRNDPHEGGDELKWIAEVYLPVEE